MAKKKKAAKRQVKVKKTVRKKKARPQMRVTKQTGVTEQHLPLHAPATARTLCNACAAAGFTECNGPHVGGLPVRTVPVPVNQGCGFSYRDYTGNPDAEVEAAD